MSGDPRILTDEPAVTIPDGWQKIDLPVGPSLWYCDERHAYHVCKEDGTRGKRLTSVSSLVKPLDYDAGRLMNWAAHKNGEGIAILAADGLSQEEPDDIHAALQFLHSADSIWSALTDAELTYNHLRDKKGAVGTNVHLALEDLAAGKLPAVDAYPAEEQGYVQGLLKWWMERAPYVLNSEQFVLSTRHGYCGRFDLRAEIDGQVVLADLKTSGYISPAYLAQLGGYAVAAEECGVGGVNRMLVLKVTEDGGFREVEAPPDAREAFLAAADVYRRASQLNKVLRAA